MASEYLDPSKLPTPDADSGIAAITKPAPKPPYAMPKIVRGPDGLMHTIYVDPQSGQAISNLKGYTILDGNNYYTVTDSDDTNKDGAVDTKEAKTNTQKVIQSHTTAADVKNSGQTGSFKTSQNPMNNFGYAHKPGVVSALGYVPGPLGLAAKAVNMGWNANNLAATNTARSMLGLAPLGVKGTVKGLLSNNKGQVARVSIGDQNYSVGFEATDKQGRTNLTPTEANTRANLKGGLAEVADPAAAGTKKGGAITAITGIQPGWAKNALNNVFGITPEATPAPKTNPTTRPENMPTTNEGVSNSTKARNSSVTSANVGTPGATVNGVGFKSAFGPNRPNMPNQSIVSAVQTTVGNVFGPGYTVVGVSGTENPGEQYGSTRHKTGLAMDFDVVGPDGQKVSTNQMNDLAAAFAQAHPDAGIGFGDGYMAKNRMHLDITGQAKEWGKDNTVANMSQALKQSIDAAREGYTSTPFSNMNAPPSRPGAVTTGFVSQDERAGSTGNVANAAVPGGTSVAAFGGSNSPRGVNNNTGYTPSSTTAFSGANTPRGVNTGTGVSVGTGFVSQSEKTNTGNVSNYRSSFVSQDERSSMADRMGTPTPKGLDPVGTSLSPMNNVSSLNRTSADNVGQKTVSNSVQASTSAKIGTSPAAMAAMGLTNRSASEKAAMARAISGELSQNTISGLKKGDPAALAEFGNITASMENRAASKSYDGIANTLNPTQYQSLLSANLATTNANYSKNKAAMDAAMASYYSGVAIPGVNYNVTSYYNPTVSDPAWGPDMANQAKVGEHLFGTLPNYGPDADARAAAAAMSVMAGTTYSPGKAKDDNVGGYQGLNNSPSAFSGANTPRGVNTGYSGNTGGYSSTGTGSGGASGYSAGATANGFGGSNSPRGMNTGSGMGSGGGASSGTGSSASGGFGGQGSPRGMGMSSPGAGSSSSSSAGSSAGAATGFGGSNSPRGMGSSGSPGGGYATGASKGSTGGL